MKIVNFIIVCFLMTFNSFDSFSQLDVAVGGNGFMANSIAIGQTSTYSVSMGINGNETDMIPTGCLLVIISLDPDTFNLRYLPIDTVPPINLGGFGSSFDWLYSKSENALYGYNNTDLFDGDGGIINLTVLGNNLTPSNGIQSSTNIFEDGCSFGNAEGNDGNSAPLIVTTALPVKFSKMFVVNQKCSGNNVTWVTSSEINNSYFVVEASKDGKKFESLGKIKGTNRSSGSEYSFFDNSTYANSQVVLYRIKQVDLDGKFEYSDIVSSTYHCEKELGITLNPNPAKDEVRVEISGVEDNEIAATLHDGAGAIVKKVVLKGGTINKIDISALTPGIYTINTNLNGTQLTQRFIKIN